MPISGRAWLSRSSIVVVFVLLLGACAGTPSASGQSSDEDTLNASIGRATRADFLQQLGPPVQSASVDGDHFLVYVFSASNALLDAGDALSAFSAGFQGRQHTPAPRPLRQLILRFDGQSGKLKAWNIR